MEHSKACIANKPLGPNYDEDSLRLMATAVPQLCGFGRAVVPGLRSEGLSPKLVEVTIARHGPRCNTTRGGPGGPACHRGPVLVRTVRSMPVAGLPDLVFKLARHHDKEEPFVWPIRIPAGMVMISSRHASGGGGGVPPLSPRL